MLLGIDKTEKSIIIEVLEMIDSLKKMYGDSLTWEEIKKILLKGVRKWER